MLKNVLSLLLSKFYSKKESGEVAHQAMPMGDSITLNLTKDSDATYVAPTDGYFNVDVESSGYINCWSTLLAAASNGTWNKIFIPCKKGEVVNYHINGNIIYAAFVKLVGGGVQAVSKLILQGGVLCRLSRLYSSLRRSSWLARRSGWQSNRQFLRAIQSRSLLLPTEKTITSQCPAQGTPTCAVMVFGLSTLTGAPSLTSGLMRTGISASIYTPKRVNSLDMLWGLVPNSLRLISIFTRPKAVSNLVVGGASC